MTIALEREHGVDDVLEDARAREPAFLGDVANQHDGHAPALRFLDEPVGALSHLDH